MIENMIDFLEARIIEDAQDARDRALLIEDWQRNNGVGAVVTDLMSPARVIAECIAKRDIISIVKGMNHYSCGDDGWYSCPQSESYDGPNKDSPCDCGTDEVSAAVLHSLLSVYQDHPDYPQEYTT